MSTTTKYTYKSLHIKSAIRLIRILPDKVDDKVVCILHYFDQAEAPPYRAVSYTWGDPTPVGSIYLGEDFSHTHLHPLHRNLLEFLRCMWEQQMFDGFFWTDSLCLNQDDKSEKAHQVPRMGDIYSNADEVLIWLGHESEKEEKMKIIQDWPLVVDCGTLDIRDSDEYESTIRNKKKKGLTHGKKDHSVKRAAEYLLLLPYWGRVWIVQEVALSRKALVVCGNASLDLDTFRKKIMELRSTWIGFKYRPQIWSLFELRDQKGKMPLWQLMGHFCYSESSLAVDKVYGFVGLMEDSGEEISIAGEVNYEKPVAEVFWDAVFECRAPWRQYSHILCYLGFMVRDHTAETIQQYLIDLQSYIKSHWTSERHDMFAEIALRAFEVARIFVRENKIKYKDWDLAIDSVFSEIGLASGEHSELQNAAAVGLALSTKISETFWRDQGVSERYWEWRKQESFERADFVGTRGLSWNPVIAIELTTPVPNTVYLSYFKRIGEWVDFRIESSSFRLVVELDLDTGYPQFRSWKFSLDTTVEGKTASQ